MGRGIVIVLAVSLGLNFFAAGALFNNWLNPPAPPPHAANGFKGYDSPRGLARMAEALPPESRLAFREAFRERLPDMRSQFREMYPLREQLNALIAAEEWDSAAVAAKMDEIRAVRERQQEAFDAAFLEAVTALSAEDRKSMIELARQRRMERRKKHRRRMDMPPPPSE